MRNKAKSARNHLESWESNALTLTSACKTAYTGVLTGVINNITKCHGNVITWAADKTATNEEKSAAAKKITVAQAMQYDAIYNDDFVNKINTGCFYYYTGDTSSKGIIIFNDSGTAPANTTRLTLTTTLGEMYA